MIFLFGCTAISGEKIPFSTLAKGYYAYGIKEGFEVVINDGESFSSLWDEVVTGVTPPPPMPEVDFNTNMIIAVSPGEQPTGGYDVEIAEIDDLGGKLEVVVIFRKPSPDDLVPTVITQPYHIVSIELRDVPVEFEWEYTTH